ADGLPAQLTARPPGGVTVPGTPTVGGGDGVAGRGVRGPGSRGPVGVGATCGGSPQAATTVSTAASVSTAAAGRRERGGTAPMVGPAGGCPPVRRDRPGSGGRTVALPATRTPGPPGSTGEVLNTPRARRYLHRRETVGQMRA